MKYKVWVPPTMEMGSYMCTADNSSDALEQYNSARAHDGLGPVKRMPKGTEYTMKTLMIRMEAGLHKRFKVLAVQKEMSMATLIIRAIEKYLKEEEK